MIENPARIVALIEGGWEQVHILVVGDLMLDRYIWGDVERISPEAPVPVVRAAHRSHQPGGAANVAMNIAALGALVTVVGCTGEDEDGAALECCLAAAGVHTRLIAVQTHPTTSKLRILGGQQQILRLDTEQTTPYPDTIYDRLLDDVRGLLGGVDAVVLSDYAKGVLSESVCRGIIDEVQASGVPVLVDPKHRDFSRYAGATALCPNFSELAAAVGGDPRLALEEARALLPLHRLDQLIVTLGAGGIALVRRDGTRTFAALARQVFDVSGAGDTVIAVLALTMACGLPVEDALPLANIAAGIVVRKVGTVPVTRDELLASLMPELKLRASEKVLSVDRLITRIHAWRSAGDRIVFTNGCFDLLHVGHITLMEDARRCGDRLVVAINSDESVRALKGAGRPVVGEVDRGRVLAALAAVDAVVVFGEATPLKLIEKLRPDVLVKGGDYTEEIIVGAREVRSWGGVVRIVPTIAGFSTTQLLARAAQPAAG
jgi:D-beta-D-heptose 7-phosphate kinase/D-beta-D-heptose 1-phosphate adenosyltransferase